MSKTLTVLVLGVGLWSIFMCLIVGITGIQDLKTIGIISIIVAIVLVIILDFWIFKGD